jgi:hypothetical protein
MATQAITKPEVTELEKGLAQLQSEARAVVKVSTPQEYASAGSILVAIRNYQKDVKNKLNPFVDIARRALDAARQEMNKYLNQAQELEMVLTRPMEDFKRREREAAEAEQRRINEERRVEAARLAEEQRKADEARAKEEREKREKEIKEAQKAGELKKREAEKMRKEAEERERQQREQAAKDAEAAKVNVQEVKVMPSTPKIAGTRGRVNYYAEFRNLAALLDAFVDARVKQNIERATYLRQFICGDDKALGKEARDKKDSKKLEGLIPGIRAWDEDSI